MIALGPFQNCRTPDLAAAIISDADIDTAKGRPVSFIGAFEVDFRFDGSQPADVHVATTGDHRFLIVWTNFCNRRVQN